MSYLAIGAVTKAMAELLGKKLNKPPLLGTTSSFRVTTLPPDDDRVSEDNGINLFLYKIAESPFAKNMNWRGDRLQPLNGDRPPLSLTLQYLVTAYAKKTDGTAQDDITAHQLLGNAMAVLHEYPVLNEVHDSDFDAALDPQFAAELRNAFEKIKVTLLPISMEEFSKIWTGLSKAYRLSVAYEVSLVEISPIGPVIGPGPVVQDVSLQTQTLAVPQIVSINPEQGPVATQVKLTGQGFVRSGAATAVTVGDTDLSGPDLITLTNEQIEFLIPEALQRGPQIPITVSVGGQESLPISYSVAPWIGRITPLRGIPGIPVKLDFIVPAGATVSAEIDGQAVAATVDAATNSVFAVVPLTVATNGPKPVTLIVNDGAAKRSNTLTFEVTPLITNVNVTTSAVPVQTTLTITGERLNGSDVSANVAGLLLRKGTNTTATQLVIVASRTLPASQPVVVLVDGRSSNVLPARLDEVNPAAAFAGDTVTLTGSGLSGRSVSIAFGATVVNLGAQPSASRFAVRVPGSLAAGPIAIKVTVDGQDTNSISFTVSG